MERVLRTIAHTGIGVGARYKRHLLANRDEGFLVIERQQARRRQDIRVTLRFQCVEDDSHSETFIHYTPAQCGAGNLRKRTGDCACAHIFRAIIRHNRIGERTIARLLSRTGADVATVKSALIGEQPLQTELLSLGHLHLNDDGLDQHLCPSDIEPRDHRLQGCHLIGIRGNDQAVCPSVGLDG